MMFAKGLLRASALTCLLMLALASFASAGGNGQRVDVWKSPSCGCCGKWVEHMQAAGFKVHVHDTSEMHTVKSQNGVPISLRSCHTATVDGYVIEGHVPAADVMSLLAKKPKVIGLSVPGMPLGSPGMEVPSGETEPFETVTFDRSGKAQVFAKHGRGNSDK